MASSKADQEKEFQERARALVERGRRSRWWRRLGSKEEGFRYVTADDRPVKDASHIERIQALVIPPAWQEVRISPSMRGRLQAVGVDTLGRIQYKYHPAYAARQQKKKYEKIERFGHNLPSLRRATNEHLSMKGLSRERVLAVVIRLINDLYFRIGSEASVKRYRTYGVTTLRNRHLEIKSNGRLIFKFRGKHHVRQRRILVDKELAAILRELKRLGGPKLFEYVGEDGRIHPVKPKDVNEYIKTATSTEFSAKDFRTWGGTLLAAINLADLGEPPDEKQAKKNIVEAVERVADRLGNTPAVCRSCYIHPVIFDRYVEGVTLEEFRPKSRRVIRRIQPEYEPEEYALLKLFRAASNGKC